MAAVPDISGQARQRRWLVFRLGAETLINVSPAGYTAGHARTQEIGFDHAT
jgi:hypothetical protein